MAITETDAHNVAKILSLPESYVTKDRRLVKGYDVIYKGVLGFCHRFFIVLKDEPSEIPFETVQIPLDVSLELALMSVSNTLYDTLKRR